MPNFPLTLISTRILPLLSLLPITYLTHKWSFPNFSYFKLLTMIKLKMKAQPSSSPYIALMLLSLAMYLTFSIILVIRVVFCWSKFCRSNRILVIVLTNTHWNQQNLKFHSFESNNRIEVVKSTRSTWLFCFTSKCFAWFWFDLI